jgi:hypothetical protein
MSSAVALQPRARSRAWVRLRLALRTGESYDLNMVEATNYQPIHHGGRVIETTLTVRQGLMLRTMSPGDAIRWLRAWGISDDEICSELSAAGVQISN